MKSNTPLLPILVVVTIALAGCNQNGPGNSSGVQSTNSTIDDASGIPAGFTNMPATNGLPYTNTEVPVGPDQKLIAVNLIPSE